jgi:AraC-like DNA-binding protein
MEYFREFAFKQFGYFDFEGDLPQKLGRTNITEYIKIAFVRAGGSVVIDFQYYELKEDALFFINKGQYHHFNENCKGSVIYYNRDFYCVEIHDAEVACDGILFHNVYEVPMVPLSVENSTEMQRIVTAIKKEFEQELSSMQEMLRILLKQILIGSTRIWKGQNEGFSGTANEDFEFSRQFSQLVEVHFTRLHTVAEYAQVLNITPKALSKRISRISKTNPNEIIKERIVLEAKRLLAHTDLSVKEIGYKLEYDDISYFIRMFSGHSGITPQQFRQQYQQKL